MINIRVCSYYYTKLVRIFMILILNETQSPAPPPQWFNDPPHRQISDLPVGRRSRFLGCFV